MPHQCTNCGRTFPDGSKEMLSGCPDCGGNKFQFEPSGGGSVGSDASTASADATTASDGTADASASSGASTTDNSSGSGVSGTVSQAKQTVSDWVGRGDSSNTEDTASASAEDATSASAEDATSASDESRSGSDADEQNSSNPGSASPRQDVGERSRSNIESTGDWPDVGSRDPTDDPTRSGDHPSRPDDAPSQPDDAPSRPADSSTPAGDVSTRTPGDEAASAQPPSSEDAAQANARTDVVDPNDLPHDSVSEDAGSRDAASEPSLADAREDAAERSSASPDSTPSRQDAEEQRSPNPASHTQQDAEAQRASNPSSQARRDAGGTEHPFDENEEPPADADGQVVGTPDDEQPDLEALRQELNEQFESIKIVRPGEYELNLMELYDRDEYIISLMEDGRYAIEVPDAWRDGE